MILTNFGKINSYKTKGDKHRKNDLSNKEITQFYIEQTLKNKGFL